MVAYMEDTKMTIKNMIFAAVLILGVLVGGCDEGGMTASGDAGTEAAQTVDGTGVDAGACSVIALATVPGMDLQQDIPLGSFSGRTEAGTVVYVDGSPIPAGCWAFYGAKSLHVLPMVFRDNNPHVIGISFDCSGVAVPAGHPNAGATCGWW